MDCPVHAMNNAGEVEVALQNGPLPGEPPQVGEVLHVYYQFGNDRIPQVGLLFLLRGEQLIYFVVNGIFIDKFNVYYANKYTLPLVIEMRSISQSLANPAWRVPRSSWCARTRRRRRWRSSPTGPQCSCRRACRPR